MEHYGPSSYYACMSRAKLFQTVLKVPADDDLRAALAQAAADERTTVAEVARRALRQALSQRPAATPARPRAA